MNPQNTNPAAETLLAILETGTSVTTSVLAQRLHLPGEAVLALTQSLTRQGYRLQMDQEGYIRLLPHADSLLPGYIRMGLPTKRIGQGSIFYEPEMGSTNTVLKQRATENALPEGSLAVCDRQVAGKGRLQRAWEMPDAGVALPVSVLLTPSLPPAHLPLVTLAVAVAAAAAIEAVGQSPGVKWPNDVVLNGRKCVGILCEMGNGASGNPFIVAGAGFNVNQSAFAGELAQKATSLAMEAGHPVDRLALLQAYLVHLERAMELLTQSGPEGLMPEYEARSVTLRRRVQVIGATEVFEGLATRVDETGALYVLDDQGTLRRVLSGDVSVRGVMGYV